MFIPIFILLGVIRPWPFYREKSTRHENRGAEGGGVWGKGKPLPRRLGSLEERRKRSPGRQRFLCILEAKNNAGDGTWKTKTIFKGLLRVTSLQMLILNISTWSNFWLVGWLVVKRHVNTESWSVSGSISITAISHNMHQPSASWNADKVPINVEDSLAYSLVYML